MHARLRRRAGDALRHERAVPARDRARGACRRTPTWCSRSSRAATSASSTRARSARCSSPTADELGKVKELQHLAIDPLDQVFTWPTFQYLLAERAAKMKQLLMDQKFIAGLGNIYSDEVLFAAGLRFDRMSRHAVLAGGAPALPRDPGDAAGGDQGCAAPRSRTRPTSTCSASRGSTASELKVYGRAGLPCRRCRTPIQSVKISERSAYFCPQCQS